MRIDGKSTRLRERTKLRIPVVVRYQETPERAWKEETQLREVTPFGAGFNLNRPVEPGRLVHLTMPLPKEFRFFDFAEPRYQIWGVVRYVGAHAPDVEGVTTFSLGVAFIGKDAPSSYRIDPTTLYDLRPTLARGGGWVARQQPRVSGKFKRSEDKRYAKAFQITIEAFDEAGRVAACEVAETENVSRRGAAVSKTHDISPGSFVRLTNPTLGLSILSVVRASRVGADGNRRLHLEFFGGQWPLDSLD
jgi:hypothetical protein